MLFNSFGFAIFLPLIFLVYWFFFNEKLRAQNITLLIASYYFYSCWDWRFLFLLVFSTFLDFFTGLKVSYSKNVKERKFWFWLSIIVNLGFLGLFKYYNFFVDSFENLLGQFNIQVNLITLNVILPVGISFYTFHGLSYVIDIYKNRITPERNFINYSLFVSFFPLLVAGPIERATHLLPQIIKGRNFDYLRAVDGLKQILWGLFKKVVIADNCAELANLIFDNSSSYSGSTLFLGALFFAFQIYGDFSGYSDIALGTARLFGIELLRNFAYPYFSRDIAEFWRRWHISLTSWFRDYVYIPLGGSKGGIWMKIRNTFIIFLLSGFWHGANWTFIVWGALNALYFLPVLLMGNNRTNLEIVAKGMILPSIGDFLKILLTFLLTLIAWVFFRANDLTHAMEYLSGIFSPSFFQVPYFAGLSKIIPLSIFLLLFILIEWLGREGEFALQRFGSSWNKSLKISFYYVLVLIITYFGNFSENQFIYFQF